MQHFKSRLTRIKGLLESKLQDGPDPFGYGGVDKPMLLQTCDEIYALAEVIEAKDTPHQFEVLVLKRYEAKIHEDLKKFLEDDASGSKAKEKFEGFLENFSRLYERTKQAYFIVSKDGLRDELEIQRIGSHLSALKAQQVEYEGQVEKLRKTAETATTRAQEIEAELDDATRQIIDQSQSANNASIEIHEHLGEVRTWHGAISVAHGEVEQWTRRIETTLERAKANETVLVELLARLKDGIAKLEAATEKSTELTTETQAVHEQNQALIEEIRNTLGDSNRVGMAASFQEQMRLVKVGQEQWKWIFIGGLLLLATVSSLAFFLKTQNGIITWQSAFPRVAIVTPLVWLAWFAARQYGFASRVREDYTYKYASAMAYEGYKKAVREADPTLEKSLVEVAISNMAQNPVRLYSPKESDHASPFSEFFDKVFGRVRGVKAGANQSGVSAEANLSQEDGR